MESIDRTRNASLIDELSPQERERLSVLLDRYLAGLERGVAVDREALLAENPGLSEHLARYLDSIDALHDAAAGFAPASEEREPPARSDGELGCLPGQAPTGSEPGCLPGQAPSSDDADERRLGDYVLGAEIGRGGMGVVYEATQMSLGRRVALKVLPFAAVLDAKQIARFKNEAHSAAQIHHPNIVPVFAVGSERGVYYYAMQLIEGQPLDRAIADLRADETPPPVDASTETERAAAAETSSPALRRDGTALRAFLSGKRAAHAEYYHTVVQLGIQAAGALHAAHEFGVVHRDVKPSNLLLDGSGKLWITDFGLARCQNNATLTRTGDVVGTMRYMSPEQALGDGALVDHRTDVYSLGATLYELLTLTPAYPGEAGAALLTQIEQGNPRALRQVASDIPADLETIILKAMSRSRDDRYATAEQFADDLKRFAEGRPPVAQAPTWIDRLGKWARRHKRAVLGCAAAGLLAIVGLAASTVIVMRWKVQADQSHALAEKNYRQARTTVDRFGARMAERLADIPGAEEVRRELLLETLDYYRRFAEQSEDDPQLRADLGMTYSKIGTISDQIGEPREALDAHRKAQEVFDRLAAAEPNVPAHRGHLALCHNNIGELLRRAGKTGESEAEFHQAIELQLGLIEEHPDDARWQSEVAISYSNLGLLQSQSNDTAAADRSLRQAIARQKKLLDEDPENAAFLRDLAGSYNNLSSLYPAASPEATAAFRQAAQIQLALVRVQPEVLEFQSGLAMTYNNLGSIQSTPDRRAELFGLAVKIQEQLVRKAPARESYRRDLAASCNNLGLAEFRLGRLEEAETHYRRSLGLHQQLVLDHPGDIDLHSRLGGIYNNLGTVLEQRERADETAEALAGAIRHQRIAHDRAPEEDRYRVFLSQHYFNYGRVLRRLGRPDQAVSAALARKQLWPGDPKKLFGIALEIALSCELLDNKNVAVEEKPPAWRSSVEACVAVLRESAACGNLDVREKIAEQPIFAGLHVHPEFSALMTE